MPGLPEKGGIKRYISTSVASFVHIRVHINVYCQILHFDIHEFVRSNDVTIQAHEWKACEECLGNSVVAKHLSNAISQLFLCWSYFD